MDTRNPQKEHPEVIHHWRVSLIALSGVLGGCTVGDPSVDSIFFNPNLAQRRLDARSGALRNERDIAASERADSKSLESQIASRRGELNGLKIQKAAVEKSIATRRDGRSTGERPTDPEVETLLRERAALQKRIDELDQELMQLMKTQ